MKKFLQEGTLLIGILIALSACASPKEKAEMAIIENNNDMEQTESKDNVQAENNKKIQERTSQDTNLLQPAKWSVNTLMDTDIPQLDYADDHKIIFHTYFGLFVYDLDNSCITESVDLEKINCQKVQGGGKTEFFVSENGEQIWLRPYQSEDMYHFDSNKDMVVKMDYMIPNKQFQKMISKWDVQKEILENPIQLCSDNVILLSDGTYGYISIDTAEITTIKFHGFHNCWQLFQENDAPQEPLIKQEDSFYRAYRIYADKSLSAYLNVYSMFYNMGDYAGICTLSKGLEYTDEQQSKWSENNESINIKAEDEKNDMMWCKCDVTTENGEKKELFLNLEKEGNSWYAIGLPQ